MAQKSLDEIFGAGAPPTPTATVSPTSRKSLDEIFGGQPSAPTANSSGRKSLDDIFKSQSTNPSASQGDLPKLPPAPATQEPGFWDKAKNFVVEGAKGVARPFVKELATGAATLEGAGNLIAGGVNKVLGNNEAAQQNFNRANQVTEQGYNVPIFGQTGTYKAGTVQENGTIKPSMETLKTLGGAAEIASTVAGGGAGANLAEQGTKATVKQLVKQGAKEGALIGATGGFGLGAQEDNATAGSILSSTAKGAAFGGVVGGLASPASKFMTKEGRAAFKAESSAAKSEKALNDAIDVVSPKLTNKVKEQALSEGRISSKGLLKKQVVAPSTEDKAIAESVQGLVSSKAQPVENITNIKSGIKDVAESHVRPVLEANPRPYNMNTFKARIGDLKMPTLFKADPTMERTYQLVQQRAAEIADQYPKTKLGSWQARQAFDQAVEKEFPRVFDGSAQDNVIKHAVNDVRGAWNDFIVEGLPENNGVKNAFKQMSRMYTAADNIAEKGASEVGSNSLQRFAKNNPKLTKILELGTASALGGGVYSKGKEILGN